MDIRNATLDDTRLIAQCTAAAVGFYDFEAVPTEEQERALEVLQEACAMEDTLYSYRNTRIAETGGKAIGCLISYPGEIYAKARRKTWKMFRYNMGDPSVAQSDAETAPGEFYLDTMAVIPQFRGYGAGRMLIMDGIGKGRRQGYEKISLIVENSKPRLKAYYESMGFVAGAGLVFMGEEYTKMLYIHP